MNNRDTTSSATLVGHTSMAESSKSRTTSTVGTDIAKREMPPPMSGVSYAVAIYPYMAEQDDEFDVIV